jgi:hypothetical protein
VFKISLVEDKIEKIRKKMKFVDLILNKLDIN